MSRRFVARTKVALQELMAKDLSDLHIVGLLADGIEVPSLTMVTALGIRRPGQQARTRPQAGLDREQDCMP